MSVPQRDVWLKSFMYEVCHANCTHDFGLLGCCDTSNDWKDCCGDIATSVKELRCPKCNFIVTFYQAALVISALFLLRGCMFRTLGIFSCLKTNVFFVKLDDCIVFEKCRGSTAVYVGRVALFALASGLSTWTAVVYGNNKCTDSQVSLLITMIWTTLVTILIPSVSNVFDYLETKMSRESSEIAHVDSAKGRLADLIALEFSELIDDKPDMSSVIKLRGDYWMTSLMMLAQSPSALSEKELNKEVDDWKNVQSAAKRAGATDWTTEKMRAEVCEPYRDEMSDAVLKKVIRLCNCVASAKPFEAKTLQKSLTEIVNLYRRRNYRKFVTPASDLSETCMVENPLNRGNAMN